MSIQTPTPRQWRVFRWQFSVRTLVIVVTLWCIAVGYIGHRVNLAAKQRAAVAALRALGARVVYDYESVENPDKWWFPTSTHASPGPRWLVALFGEDFVADVSEVDIDDPLPISAKSALSDDTWLRFPRLERVSIAVFSPSTEQAISGLPDLASLKELRLCYCSNNALAHVNRFRNLIRLVIAEASINDDGIQPLLQLKSLERLALQGCDVTDNGIARLCEAKGLRALDLRECPRVTNESLLAISKLPKVDYLDIDGTQITDDGLRHIKSFPSLRHLVIDSGMLTETAVAHLNSAKQLKELEVRVPFGPFGLTREASDRQDDAARTAKGLRSSLIIQFSWTGV